MHLNYMYLPPGCTLYSTIYTQRECVRKKKTKLYLVYSFENKFN